MNPCKKYIPVIASVVLSFLVNSVSARSVYVVSDNGTYVIDDSFIRAYKIDGNSLIYQVECKIANKHAVSLAIDESEYYQYLFVALEDLDKIELINANSMESVGVVTAPGATNLVGIALDTGKRKLYAVDRYTNHLYSYSWYPTIPLLIPDFDEPYYIELPGMKFENPYGAFGIALDESTHRLYIANRTNQIQCYSSIDWSKEPNIPVTCNAISVAVDVNRQLLYYGSMGPEYGDGDPNLYQYNLSSGYPQKVNVGTGCSVAGIAVDQQTGLVYLTTYGGYTDYNYPDPPQDRLMIYDSNLVKQPAGQPWESGDIGNPAGICVPIGDTGYKPPNLILTKADDINDANCVLPGQYINYTIAYDANAHSVSNVRIKDYLPQGVDYNLSSPDGNYNAVERTVTWNIGTVGPNDSNNFILKVKVNALAEPLGELINVCIIESDSTYNSAEVNTPVCCWNPGVIYVDDTAAGDTGMSWKNAYLDLNDALERASHGCGSQIWIATGTYKPPIPQGQSATFELVSGIPVYGGFAGNENSLDQRNLHNPNNETILTGLLYVDVYSYYADNVVSATNVNSATILDGFTITEGSQAGINITGGSPTISNCNIRANLGNGLCSSESHVTVSNCTIADNGYDGINIPQTFVAKTVKVKDNFIHNNGTNGTGSGINISFYYTVYPQVTIRNNTILNNAGTGILLSLASSSPAIVTNNIIWGNNTQISGAATVTYCCVQDGYSGATNTDRDPCFINAISDPNDYHLGPDSVSCIDKGKPNSTEPNETDLDGEDRVMDGDYNNTFIVDIGADEYFWPKADFNHDGIVNFFDYAIFAAAWGEPNSDVNLAGDLDIEMDDLDVFCFDWLWIAPWSDLYETLMSQPDSGMDIPEQSIAVESIMLESAELSQSYDEQLISAESPDIDRLIDWLDDAWLAGEITEAMTEQEYLDFRQSLADSAE